MARPGRAARPMRILIAEDDAALGEGLAGCLRAAGHRVWLACDGAAAVQALREKQLDLLVLDHGLPRVHGVQVLRQARDRDTRLPVLLMSALDDAEAHVARAGLSVDGFLAKPFGLPEFESLVARIAARCKAAPADFGALRCDPASGDITLAGAPLHLPADERALLTLLVSEAGRPLSGAEIARRLGAADGSPPAIDGCVRRLRDHLRPQALDIAQLRGLGFCLTHL